ncbi:dihydroorotate dehydrogenase electron transfer subunit [Streptococcus sciuri]|uniref:Dihydroorotate dehydrogenase B (NAD(+)), electron transfer subunit n=1 Tax=Streptococcus sciuri TaxID=2973939 RepID=A0ABT2F5H1_9STRE|nr:dihydroorotate dehydrogenase electron transfer subunit [Streptococcus sciuri]MCS4487720.1 dihydroorotate dehydrogenase electron transfer subunit [Streptococcus sciuri]
MLLKENMIIVSQREIAPRIYEMVLTGDLVDSMTIGQFLHIRVPDATKLLRRPISISQVDKTKKEVTLVYRIEGAGTELFSKLCAGDILDCMGPQGNGFHIDFLEEKEAALIVGGGIGVPPLVELAKQLHERGVCVTAVLGFATADAVILENELACYADVIVTTDDGSYGIKGYVSTVIDEMTQTFDAVYACGALGMLAYVDRKFEKHPHAYISLESRMACGMGACYACVVHLREQSNVANKRVCEEGPVFETGSIILE